MWHSAVPLAVQESREQVASPGSVSQVRCRSLGLPADPQDCLPLNIPNDGILEVSLPSFPSVKPAPVAEFQGQPAARPRRFPVWQMQHGLIIHRETPLSDCIQPSKP
ncbi:hypothetical protein ACRRTK_013319 [Alexandromys fortis]